MEQNKNKIFDNMKIENGIQIIDVETEVNKYDLLSMLFHRETISVDNNIVFSVTKNDKKRYFEDTTVCYNCGEIGHVSRDCTAIKPRNCMYCDMEHKGKSCNFLFCENCWKLGHLVKYCTQKKISNTICKLCPLQNHYEDECPRPWRRYNLKKFRPKNKLLKCCPLCFSNSHFLDDCSMQDRKYTIFTSDYLKTLIKPKTQDKISKNRF